MSTLRFEVAGLPETKGSWVSVGRGKMRRDNPRERAWSDAVAWSAKLALTRLAARASVPRPTSRFAVTIVCYLPPAVGQKNKRDVDKLARSVLDALTGIVYGDDEQVDSLAVRKFIVPPSKAGAYVRVAELKARRAS